MKFFIECTNTYRTHHNSGIQRVVRSLVKSAFASDESAVCVPVIYSKRKFVGIKALIPFPVEPKAGTSAAVVEPVYSFARTMFHRTTAMITRVLPFEPVIRFVYAPRTRFGLAMMIFLPIQIFRFARGKRAQDEFNTVSMQAGDVLILLDSSWNTDFWPSVEAARRRGIKIAVVIYDLIPLLHPQFCLPATVAAYRSWLEQALSRADMLIAISRTTALTIQNELSKFFPSYRLPCISYFWLGSELDGETVGNTPISPGLVEICSSDVPTYLYVSTIEPRKNHRYSLAAFEELWAMGVHANYMIVGRAGWDCEEFLSEVQGHREFGKQLFFQSSVDDRELAFLYKNAAGLIFTSFTEGFGLPVIEGLQRRLPVFASDIPVFREIGRAGVQFVDLASPISLALALATHIENGTPKASAGTRWLTWSNSLSLLKNRIQECSLQPETAYGKVVQSIIPDLVTDEQVA